MLAVSGTIALAVALFFLAQAIAAVVWPARLRRMIGGFAATAKRHFIELGVRFAAGAAFLHYASQMAFEAVFQVFGYLLLVTTFVLSFVPWRLHRRFAVWTVPLATRNLAPYAVGSAFAGCFIVYAFAVGAAGH